MAFDFLPDQQPPEPKPNTEEAAGGQFSVGKNVFYDDYKHHLDAHALFETPPQAKNFKLPYNFNEVKDYYFDEYNLKNKIKNNFYGSGTTLEKLKEGYTTFQDPKLLNETINKIDNEIPAEMFSAIDKPKMKINDRFGMFSFDLASMAMTFVFDYYTRKGEQVDSSFVEKDKSTSRFIFLPTKEEVEQRIRRRADGTPVVVSSVRNSLIDFEKDSKQDRSVEIMVFNSFAGREDAGTVIYNSMASISVAKNLLLKGFRVKLTSVLVVAGAGKNYFHFVPAKRFNQPLDINAAAYVCGDPRFFRYQGFKMICSGYDRDGERIVGGLGTILTNIKPLSLTIEKEYVSNSELKQADTRLYFGGSRSLRSVNREVKQAIEILNNKYGNEKN
ncbi:hypothetical protein [Salinimicrobium oceani]|uniref:Uncharacterized protein n=1 Tax=Salinimicrobium oceani TaxID=2722702 RepID=A0ABX1CZ52_9FLAO|nr:hypothetical protein [Salinimicrobium oceani]NJW53560.1 hypothetical protein [Salinimicrobium oceani]